MLINLYYYIILFLFLKYIDLFLLIHPMSLVPFYHIFPVISHLNIEEYKLKLLAVLIIYFFFFKKKNKIK